MVVGIGIFLKAVGAAVHVNAADQARFGHGVEAVVNGSHCNTRHLQFRKEKDFVGSQVAIRMGQKLQDQFALAGHGRVLRFDD